MKAKVKKRAPGRPKSSRGFDRKIGRVILRRKIAADVSSADLARAADASVSMLSRYERGLSACSYQKLKKIAAKLGTTATVIIADAEGFA